MSSEKPSHRAAGLLWELDSIEAALVEVTVPHGVSLRRGVVHRSDDLADFEVVERQGIPCTDATRTLIDLGAVIDDVVLEQALESALRRRLTSVADSGGASANCPVPVARATGTAAGARARPPEPRPRRASWRPAFSRCCGRPACRSRFASTR